jgi:hypothetical protein
LPNVIIPPISKSHTLKSGVNNEVIDKRKNYLEHFLNFCLNSEIIKNFEPFVTFIQQSNEKIFKNTMKDFEK